MWRIFPVVVDVTGVMVVGREEETPKNFTDTKLSIYFVTVFLYITCGVIPSRYGVQ
jgi:hypothetical protein